MCPGGIFGGIALNIKRAYHGVVYNISKAALEPVVAAFSDVVQDHVRQAVIDGVKDAMSPTDRLADALSGLGFRRKNP